MKPVQAENIVMDDLHYTIDTETKTAKVYGMVDRTQTEVTIPATILWNDEEYTVTSIGSYALAVSSIKKVNFATDSKLELIDLKAFAHCNNLEYITLPTSIRTIGDQAFYDSGLCEIQFLKGNNLTQIDDYAFAKCANLKYFMLPAGVQKLENNQFKNSGLEEFDFEIGSTWIVLFNNVFEGCSNLTSVAMPDSIKYFNSPPFKDLPIQSVYFSGSKWNFSTDASGLSENVPISYCTAFQQRDIRVSNDSFTYNGEVQRPEILVGAGKYKENTDYTLTWSDPKSTEVGEYTVKFSGIKENGYVGSLVIPYKITASTGALQPVDNLNVILSKDTYTYNGKEKKPAVTVKSGTAVLKENQDYTVTYSNNINAGTGTVTIKGKGSYTETVSKNFTIKKAANPIILKGGKVKISRRKLKKKPVKIKRSRLIKVKKAKGSLTYKLVKAKKSKYRKYFKINSKNGKIKISRNLKKGTYKLKVAVTAAGNMNYMKKTKKVIFKIVVK